MDGWMDGRCRLNDRGKIKKEKKEKKEETIALISSFEEILWLEEIFEGEGEGEGERKSKRSL